MPLKKIMRLKSMRCIHFGENSFTIENHFAGYHFIMKCDQHTQE